MIKSKEEAARRYVEGSVISALRLRRYWIMKGLKRDEAVRRSIRQAKGMLKISGLSEEEIKEVLIEMKEIIEELLRDME